MNELIKKFTDASSSWIVNYGPRILISIAMLIVGQWLIRLIIKWMGNILAGKHIDITIKNFLQNILRVALQVLLILGIMQVLGIQMSLFAALIAAFGVAAGLALSGTLQNFTSGLLIILFKPFRVGDNIRTQDEEGTVSAIRLFYTVVITYNNCTLVVPNSKLSNEVIFNFTLKKERRMDMRLKFSYENDFKKISEAILQCVNSCKDCLKEPAPRVAIEKLEETGFTVVINAWANSHGFIDSQYKLNEMLFEALAPFTKKN